MRKKKKNLNLFPGLLTLFVNNYLKFKFNSSIFKLKLNSKHHVVINILDAWQFLRNLVFVPNIWKYVGGFSLTSFAEIEKLIKSPILVMSLDYNIMVHVQISWIFLDKSNRIWHQEIIYLYGQWQLMIKINFSSQKQRLHKKVFSQLVRMHSSICLTY